MDRSFIYEHADTGVRIEVRLPDETTFVQTIDALKACKEYVEGIHDSLFCYLVGNVFKKE